jgi:hypothetical protein
MPLMKPATYQCEAMSLRAVSGARAVVFDAGKRVGGRIGERLASRAIDGPALASRSPAQSLVVCVRESDPVQEEGQATAPRSEATMAASFCTPARQNLRACSSIFLKRKLWTLGKVGAGQHAHARPRPGMTGIGTARCRWLTSQHLRQGSSVFWARAVAQKASYPAGTYPPKCLRHKRPVPTNQHPTMATSAASSRPRGPCSWAHLQTRAYATGS